MDHSAPNLDSLIRAMDSQHEQELAAAPTLADTYLASANAPLDSVSQPYPGHETLLDLQLPLGVGPDVVSPYQASSASRSREGTGDLGMAMGAGSNGRNGTRPGYVADDIMLDDGRLVTSGEGSNHGHAGESSAGGMGNELDGIPNALVGKTQEEIDDLKRRIVDRLEMILSPTSLPHDKLLFSLSLRNSAGWIPLSTVTKYPKLRSYADTYGLRFVAQAMRDANNDGKAGSPLDGATNVDLDDALKDKPSTSPYLGRGRESDLIIDGKGERIRRRDVMHKADTAWDRTVYAEGFGLLDPTTTTTQDAIEEWFEQFAPITVVRFRRGRDSFGSKSRGDFRGSVFCEFKTVEGAELFLQTNPKPLFNGTDIIAMYKETYLENRLQNKALRRSNVIPMEQVDPHAIQDIDKNLLKIGSMKKRKREDEDDGVVSSGGRRTNVLCILFNKHRVGVNRKTGVVINKNELVYPEKALLRFTGAGENGDWKILKEDLVNAEIEHSFLYLPRKATVGYFAAPEAIGDEVVERLRNLHLIVGDSEIEWERVEGQEERDFYAKRASFQGKLAVKMADEKEHVESEAVKETTKEIKNIKDRGGKLGAKSGGKKKAGSTSGNGASRRKHDEGGLQMEMDM